MKISKRVLAGALAAGLLATVSACGGGEATGGKVTIRFAWWGNDERATITNEAVALFMKKNPDINVETSTAVYDSYFQKLATETAGGNAPDVMQMSDRHLREYADRSALLDMVPHVGKGIQTSGLVKDVMGLGQVDGKLYGLPLGQTSVVMVYDPKAWAEAGAKEPVLGWSWDDYFEAASKISAKTGGAMSGASDFGGIESWFKIWLSQQGKGLYTTDGALGYTEQDVVTWWEQAARFRKEKAATPPEVTAVNPAGSPLQRKLSASEFQPDSTIGPKAWETFGRELKLAAPPQVGSELGLYAEPPMVLSVYNRTKNQAAALKLADFVINDPEAAKILGMSRGLPANLANREALAPTLSGPWKDVFDYEQSIAVQVKLGPPAPPKGASAITLLFAKIYEDLMYDKTTPAEAAKRFMAEAQQAIKG